MPDRRLSCDEPVPLRGGPYAATVAPSAGGRLTSLIWTDGATNCPLLVGWDGESFDAHHWPKAGAFPMLPFANRLPADGFVFEGRRYRPEPGPAGYPLHGFAHRRVWETVQAASSSVLMRCANGPSKLGWPWAWSATLKVSLEASGVTVELAVRNNSAEPMPLSMGWHPYHPTTTEFVPADLGFVAIQKHELDAQGAVSAAQPMLGPHLQRGETVAFGHWDGKVQLRIPGATLSVRTEGVEHLVVHRPWSGDYVCVEPVTSLPGRLAGCVPLAPSDERRLVWSCSVNSLSHEE